MKAKLPDTPKGSIALENVGRESHTYLYHIVENYHHLADWNVFSQSAKPDFGFMPTNGASGHLASGVHWEDYLTPVDSRGELKDWYMVQTVATAFPHVAHSDRLDMMFEMPFANGNICPREGPVGWSHWWYDNDHPLVYMYDEQPNSIDPIAFYNTLVVGDAVNTTYTEFTLNYANGARFAVSRDRIQKRPLNYYKALLEALSNSVHPIEGYYMETMWYDIFHPESLQADLGSFCEIPSLDKIYSHSSMHEEAVHRCQGTTTLRLSSPYTKPSIAAATTSTDACTSLTFLLFSLLMCGLS